MASTPPQEPMTSPMGFGSGPSQDEKTQAMLCWFLSIVTGFLAPLIFFLMANDKPFLKRHASMALGLHIIAIICYVISAILMLVLVGILTYIATGIFVLVVCIMAGIAANKGDNYDVPVFGKMISNMFKI